MIHANFSLLSKILDPDKFCLHARTVFLDAQDVSKSCFTLAVTCNDCNDYNDCNDCNDCGKATKDQLHSFSEF